MAKVVTEKKCRVCLETKARARMKHSKAGRITSYCTLCHRKKINRCRLCNQVLPYSKFQPDSNRTVFSTGSRAPGSVCRECYRKGPGKRAHQRLKERANKDPLTNLWRRLHRMRPLATTTNWKSTVPMDACKRIMTKHHGKCAYCHVPLNFKDSESWWADHVQPISKNGQNEEANIVLCCKRCNLMKSDMTYHEFLRHCLKVLEAQDPVIRMLKSSPTLPPE